MPNLTGCFRKIDRSLEHLETLNERGERLFEGNFYGLYELHGKANPQGTKLLFTAKLLKSLPLLEWGIIVGDAVHCLRSALDQLVYALSLDPDGKTAFPIFSSEKGWKTRAPSMLWGVPEPFVAAIDLSQPYHRGDAAHTHPLAVLSALSNCDKHRFIPVTALVPDSSEIKVTGMQGIASHGPFELRTGQPLEEDAVIAEIGFVPDDSGLEPQMQMDGHLSFGIAFGKTGVPSSVAGKPVIPSFKDLGEAVQQVIVDIGEAAANVLGGAH